MAKKLRSWPGTAAGGAVVTRVAAKDFTHKGKPYKKGDEITVSVSYIPTLEGIGALEPLPALPEGEE